MRPKIVIPVLVMGAVIVAVVFLLKHTENQPKVEAVAVVEPVAPVHETKPVQLPSSVAKVPGAVVAASNPPVAVVVPSVVATNVISAITNQEPQADPVVQAKIDKLEELSANYDSESLKEILNELTNTNPIIRHAAIEATTQFRDRAAVPVLEELAAHTADPGEKQELIDAAEFLKLPTYTEVMAERNLNKMLQNSPAGAGQR